MKQTQEIPMGWFERAELAERIGKKTLARMMGVTLRTVYNWTDPNKNDPKPFVMEKLRRIAKANP